MPPTDRHVGGGGAHLKGNHTRVKSDVGGRTQTEMSARGGAGWESKANSREDTCMLVPNYHARLENVDVRIGMVGIVCVVAVRAVVAVLHLNAIIHMDMLLHSIPHVTFRRG